MHGVPQQISIVNLDRINFRWSKKNFIEIGTNHDIFSQLDFEPFNFIPRDKSQRLDLILYVTLAMFRFSFPSKISS